MGITMTCSLCKSSKHNKKGCPLKPKATNPVHNSAEAASTSANESSDFQASFAPSRRKYAAPSTSTNGTSRRKYAAPSRPTSSKQFNASQQSSTSSTEKGDAIDTQGGGS